VELLRELTTEHAIVEWIPASDPRFVEIVRGRDALYSHLNEAAFISALDSHFSIVQREQLKNGRTLFLLEAR
jgi:hypothetical protein